MTHRYTLLFGGTILAGQDQPTHSAMAWAEGTVLILGSEEQVRTVSRGDSEAFDLRGTFVVPLGPGDNLSWPPRVSLEIGGPADVAILSKDPREVGRLPQPAITMIRGGHAVHGRLPPG